ncbi:hypothetical protein CANINC_001592 [Pichia inconspicua]|uniref:Conserved oligomeric Golgi complex subunit 4 n=1 Tax=Pichia inconspicua TaxID=52247 RepID=A0A4T0X3Q6_9ASCO|nr:hypothetical protein CANINC_001592 [[Candida] inconspicua]
MPLERRGSMVLDTESQLQMIHGQVDDLESTLLKAADIGQLTDLVTKFDDIEIQLDDTAQRFVSKSTLAHQSTIRSLEISRVELSSALNHSRDLKKIMESANELSYSITEKVRLLDNEKSLIKSVKDYVDNVKTLKSELARAHDAIEREDWLIASKSISIMKNLPDGLITDPYTEFKVPSSTLSDFPEELLTRWIDKLEIKFTDAFNEAAKNRNVEKLTYYFQLFPLIGKSELGLKCYSNFVCGIISEQSKSIIQNAHNRVSKPEFFAQLLFRLYQTISAIVNQHSKIIKSYYGSEAVSVVLKVIQMECDLQSNLIYETYIESKQVDDILNEIRQYSYPVLIDELYKSVDKDDESGIEEETEETSVDLVEVSQITDELSAMLNHWSMYCRFFVVIWNEYSSSNIKENQLIFPSPLILSSFGIKIQDKVISQFDSACTYIIRRSLEKACTIESLTSLTPFLADSLKFLSMVYRKPETSTSSLLYNSKPEEPPISSLADDIIMVLNTIIMELLATGELAVIKNMVSNIKRILLNDFINIIKQRIKTTALNSRSSFFTKESIEKIHQSLNPPVDKYTESNAASRSSTPVALNVSASDIATTGAMFMRSINAAINYTMAGEGSGDSSFYLIGDDSKIKQHVLYLNTLCIMSTYLTKMAESCLKSFRNNSLMLIDDQELSTCRKSANEYKIEPEIIVPTDDSMRSKVKRLIFSIPEGFKESSSLLIDENVEILFSTVLKSRVLSLIQNALRDTYSMIVEEGEYFLVETDKTTNNNTTSLVDNSKIVSFIQNWNSLIIPYVTNVEESIFERVLLLINTFAATIIEDKLWKLENKVSPSGVTKLEQEMNTIISEFTKFDYSLRQNYTRCSQIVMIAELEEDEEIAALEDPESGIEWKLSSNERVRARKLRTND